jgi:DNA-binding LytR/AlgR family response regulator
MKKIFLIEDEWIHAEDMRITIQELNYEWLGYSNEGIDAMEKIKNLQPDIVLIDLNLNGSFSGILIAKKIKEAFGLPFIFVTSYIDDEVIKNCYAVNPLAYLHKPVNKFDLKAALLKIDSLTFTENNSEVFLEEAAQNLMVRVGNQLKPLHTDDIVMIATDAKNYVNIFTNQKIKFAIKSSLVGLEKILVTKNFIRVHKEYIVNLHFVSSFNEADQIIMLDTLQAPLGKLYKSNFLSSYTIL